jgi:hypothetical protein
MISRDSNQKVEGLKRITLSLEAGTVPDRMDLTEAPLPFEFIFGVGKQGLTPFEYALTDRCPGEEILVHVDAHQTCRMFEHLILPVSARVNETQGYYLKVRIEKIATPDPHAVVKAMAATAECGEDCGCGCGAHTHFFTEKK